MRRHYLRNNAATSLILLQVNETKRDSVPRVISHQTNFLSLQLKLPFSNKNCDSLKSLTFANPGKTFLCLKR